MTDALVLAQRHAARQRRIAVTAMAAALREWGLLDAADLRASWSVVGPRLVAVLSAAQLTAAEGAGDYVDATAAAQGAGPDATGRVNATAFTGIAADGRALDTLMLRPLVTTYRSIGQGSTPAQALAAGRGLLATIVRSEVADAGRQAVGVGIAARRTIQGYVRVVQPPACGRCVILAGVEYGWNRGFQRHPRCDCIHLPTTLIARYQHRGGIRGDAFSPTTRMGSTARGFINPRAYFDSLDRAEQDRIFTSAGARAIREGADMAQVVNARRGMTTVTAYGRRVAATREGTTARGAFFRQERARTEERTGTRFARNRAEVRRGLRRFELRTPRLMPEEIYRLAENRDEAIAMLRRFGYLT
ncbi:VG15 protein [Actinacidiphila glaucinigra]|uniref:VG15 protein n=1 Tax=Actinacidiphila glaucinigra TaxID=235986 RepID=UPI0035DCFDEF